MKGCRDRLWQRELEAALLCGNGGLGNGLLVDITDQRLSSFIVDSTRPDASALRIAIHASNTVQKRPMYDRSSNISTLAPK